MAGIPTTKSDLFSSRATRLVRLGDYDCSEAAVLRVKVWPLIWGYYFDVLWFCPNCDDNGRISGWEGTFWDNSNLTEITS